MKIIIVDDEIDARIVLTSYLESYFPGEYELFEAKDVQSGIQLINKHQPQLIFLDIQMNDGTGFDLLDAIKPYDYQVIFTTAYDQYAIKAFKYCALDYLLKPIDPDDFQISIQKSLALNSSANYSQRIKKLRTIASSNSIFKVSIPTNNETSYLEVTNISHLKADGNYTEIYTVDNKRFITSRQLSNYEDLLPSYSFCRTHKSHLINIQEISTIAHSDNVLKLKSGQIVPIARRRKAKLMAMVG